MSENSRVVQRILRRPGRRAVSFAALALVVSACAGAVDSPSMRSSPLVMRSPIVASIASPAADLPTPGLPLPDPTEVADEADRANLEGWTRDLNNADLAVADTFAELRAAWRDGSYSDRIGSLDRLRGAAQRAQEVALRLPSVDLRRRWSEPVHDQNSCRAGMRNIYGSLYRDMSELVGDISDYAADPHPPRPQFAMIGGWTSPADQIADVAADYRAWDAGSLSATDIVAFCTPSPGESEPLPPPASGTRSGPFLIGSVTIAGPRATVLVQNVSDGPVIPVRTRIRFRDGAGKVLKVDGYDGTVTRSIDPGATTGALLFGASGPPKGWRTAELVIRGVEGSDADAPLTVSPPNLLTTSAGLLGSTRVVNASEQEWCFVPTIATVADGQAANSGYSLLNCQDPSVATADGMASGYVWTMVLHGPRGIGEGSYAELLRPGPR